MKNDEILNILIVFISIYLNDVVFNNESLSYMFHNRVYLMKFETTVRGYCLTIFKSPQLFVLM